MEICGKPGGLFTREITRSAEARACSACAGDYEDPDRTAPPREGERAEETGGESGQAGAGERGEAEGAQ